MNPEEEVSRLLAEHNAVLVRDGRHSVYRLPNSKTFVMAKTPSDWRAAWNQLRDLRQALGIADPERGQPGERRMRRKAPGRAEPPEIAITPVPQNTLLAEKLRMTGIVEDALEEKIGVLEAELAGWRVWECPCWWCRWKKKGARLWAKWSPWKAKPSA